MKRLQITEWCHQRIRQMMPHPVHCLDATAGTGRDTLFLCQITDSNGTVTAMDIQPEAIRQTAERLQTAQIGRPIKLQTAKTDKSYTDRLKIAKSMTYGLRTDESAFLRTIQPGEPKSIQTGFEDDSVLRDDTLVNEIGTTPGTVWLIQDGHEHMSCYLKEDSQDLILFNLGYLPGGDHDLATKPETTLRALEQSLTILKEGGLLSVLIYSGGDSGFAEKEAVKEKLLR